MSLADTHYSSILEDFLTAITGSATAQDRWGVALNFSQSLGFERLTISSGLTNIPNAPPLWSNVSKEWRQYFRSNYHGDIYTVRNGPIFTRPFAIGRQVRHLMRPLTSLDERYFEEASDAGLESGWIIPYRNSKDEFAGSIGYNSTMKAPEFERYCREYGSILHLVGLATRPLMFQDDTGQTNCGGSTVLTQREKDYLRYLAHGLRNDRIAERMNISVVTTEFHSANARRKLGAKTREQAVALALARNLIQI